MIGIAPNSRVLFQGDSITNAGRKRKNGDGLGEGYAMMAGAWFSAKYPEKKVQFLNRGISGDNVGGLRKRWQQDCLALKPNVVSILIGINDVLGKFFWNSPTSTTSFENDFREILEITRKMLQARIVIMEPFALRTINIIDEIRRELDPKISSIKRLASEFSAVLVPLDEIFEEASKKREPAFWSLDGIHPTLAGHALIAQSWLKTVTDDSLC